jgi:hypothetical protein
MIYDVGIEQKAGQILKKFVVCPWFTVYSTGQKQEFR